MARAKTPTLQDAKAIANGLVRRFRSISAVVLCGSVARGDANPWSDIDLVIIGSDAHLTSELLRKSLSRWKTRTSIMYYEQSAFRMMAKERVLFVAHLQREGLILFDKLDLCELLLKKPIASKVYIKREIRAQKQKLQSYIDARRFNNNFLFCFSHLYSIGKGVIMLGLAQRGVFEFNRAKAFEQFADLNPDLSAETHRVAELRPFYSLVMGREPGRLPFSYRSAARQLRSAVTAIEALADRAEGR